MHVNIFNLRIIKLKIQYRPTSSGRVTDNVVRMERERCTVSSLGKEQLCNEGEIRQLQTAIFCKTKENNRKSLRI